MKKITEETKNAFETEYKCAMTSVVDDEGYPHLSFITTIMAKSETELTSGEFIKGISKDWIEQKKKIGFIVMTLDKKWWTGTAKWTHKTNMGKEYDKYNQIPMFRYNTYLGIHMVHYYDLVEISEEHNLDMAGVIANAVLNIIIKPFYNKKSAPKALSVWAYKLLKDIASLKFISFTGEDGYPRIYPIVQAQACNKGRIMIPLHPYGKELGALRDGMKVAILGSTLSMENVLVKGIFSKTGKGLGYVDITRVYNSLPPKHGYIYSAEDSSKAKLEIKKAGAV